MAGGTFGEIARSNWLLCGPESYYLELLQWSMPYMLLHEPAISKE